MDQTARGRGHPATALTVPKEAASKAAPPASNSSPVWPQTQTSPRPARSSQGIYCPSRSLWISAALAPGSSLCSHCGYPRLLGQDLALPQWMLCPPPPEPVPPGSSACGTTADTGVGFSQSLSPESCYTFTRQHNAFCFNSKSDNCKSAGPKRRLPPAFQDSPACASAATPASSSRSTALAPPAGARRRCHTLGPAHSHGTHVPRSLGLFRPHVPVPDLLSAPGYPVPQAALSFLAAHSGSGSRRTKCGLWRGLKAPGSACRVFVPFTWPRRGMEFDSGGGRVGSAATSVREVQGACVSSGLHARAWRQPPGGRASTFLLS